MNKIEYNIEPLQRLRDEDYGEASARARARKLCPMPIQKETPTGLVDTVCNGDVNDNNAGLCRLDSVPCFFSRLVNLNLQRPHEYSAYFKTHSSIAVLI